MKRNCCYPRHNFNSHWSVGRCFHEPGTGWRMEEEGRYAHRKIPPLHRRGQ